MFYEELLRGSNSFLAGACQGDELVVASVQSGAELRSLTEQQASPQTDSRSRTKAARASLLSLLLLGRRGVGWGLAFLLAVV